MGSGGALRRAKGCGAWRGPRGFGFYFEGHKQSAGRAPSSFQRVTPTAAGTARRGRGGGPSTDGVAVWTRAVGRVRLKTYLEGKAREIS